MFPFLVVAALLAALLPPATELLYREGAIKALPTFLYQSTWLMAFVTCVIFVYLYRLGKPAHFVQLYLLSMVVKLVASFAFLLLMVLEDRPGAIANTLYFLVVYFLFTTVEIGFLYMKISGSRRG